MARTQIAIAIRACGLESGERLKAAGYRVSGCQAPLTGGGWRMLRDKGGVGARWLELGLSVLDDYSHSSNMLS